MKHFFFIMMLLIAVPLAMLVWWNRHIDILGILGSDFSERRLEPAQHFIKMRHVLSDPGRYNAFCFGSSRVGRIDTTKIADGCNWYNLYYSRGLPEEWLNNIRLLLRRGVTIRKLLIGLDDNSFRTDPAIHRGIHFRRPYREYDVTFYLAALLRRPCPPPDPALVQQHGCIYDIYNSGRVLSPWVDERIEADPASHVASPVFTQSSAYTGNRMEQAMDDLRNIKALADKHGIELTFFINPIHAVTYLHNNLEEFDEFKRQLSRITDYHDFSGLNDITVTNYYYYETSHYRPLVGDMILARLFPETARNCAPAPVPFGSLVTGENVESHLSRLKAEQEKRLAEAEEHS